jgi:anti-sigma factor RsiW
MLNTGDKDRLVRYLLGELSAEERQSIEEQYFQDDKFFQELLFIEDDLIDEYVQGELSAEQRSKFESQVLSTPQGRRKVESSKALLSSVLEDVEVAEADGKEDRASWWQSLWRSVRGKNRVWQLSFAAVLLLLAVGCAWLTVANLRLRSQLALAERTAREHEHESLLLQEQLSEAQRQGQTDRQRVEELARQIEGQVRDVRKEVPQRQEGSRVFASYIFPFNPVRTTGQPDNPLVISAGQKDVFLQIDLGRTVYAGYRVSLQTAEGNEVWGRVFKRARRTASGNSLTVRLPAAIFVRQHYLLIVTPSNDQSESIVEHSFRVRKD